ncbi:aminopeptidase PepB [Aliidiomarina halalkaliphila]|uniref:Aminopeptidase PepB n=1 Tax=Aliidiomarina halalkaliphila TaxID=2593535 RepID=A0A552WZE3_9GAMM|nr:aminopeptidase PepB [Aliidiomarina halalkaliphila]TRW48167.1 aminopeptidase PepB [Aliidiomarina halalkaliphila]
MSSAVKVYLTEQPAPASYKGSTRHYLKDGAMQVVVQKDEATLLRTVQQAGRKLDQLGFTQIEPAGDGWSRDRQWALAQGFTDTMNTNQVNFVGADKETLAILDDAFRWSRELINLPSSEIYPESLSERVAEKLKQAGGDAVSWNIVAGDDLVKDGRMGIHTVGRASARVPALLELDYNPTGDANAPVAYALIGKGITFDTGGYSIKSNEGMVAMKCDMGGAATVAGALLVAIRQGLKQRVKLLLCCAENMIDGTAYKNGDIITYKDGQRVEIVNTDAEGRLVLADGLIRAGELGAQKIIDAATLTGAAQVAVGTEYNALFSVDESAAQGALQSAADESEPLWRLPLASFHKDNCPSAFADTANSRPIKGGGAGGASNAAGFLLRFAPNNGAGWTHFDLAGAYQTQANALWAAGATGLGIRSIARMMLANR